MSYNRMKAVEYAHQWAFKRNPRYMNFTGIGGDCTNFVSQCLLAGGARMNYKKTFGWYYISSYDRAPAWSGVQFFYNFLVHNREIGPSASVVTIEELELGDVVQLSFDGEIFAHTLLVVEIGEKPSLENVLIATHTDDSDYRPLSTYPALVYRYLKIKA